jgi:hypothetical protein
VAAAFAKELLSMVPAQEVEQMPTIKSKRQSAFKLFLCFSILVCEWCGWGFRFHSGDIESLGELLLKLVAISLRKMKGIF